MTFEKKTYTVEDNVKAITFGIKDLVKQMEQLNAAVQHIQDVLSKNNK